MVSLQALVVALILGFIFLLFFFKPAWGLSLLLLEILLGGNGRWVEFFNGSITPRYLLAIGCLMAYFFLKVTGRLPMRGILTMKSMAFFGAVLLYGVFLGLLNGNSEYYQDAQVWVYLLVAFIVMDLGCKTGVPIGLVRLMLWGGALVAIIQLMLMVVANINMNWLSYIEPFLIQTRILITLLPGTGVYYVFMGNSSIYGYLIAVSVLLASSKKLSPFSISKRNLWFIAAVALLASMFSMTRGTWLQMAVTIILLGTDLLWHGQLNRIIIWVVCFITFIMSIIVMLNPTWRETFIARAETMLPSRNNTEDADYSIEFKRKEAELQLEAIRLRPLFGYGFGQGAYGDNLSEIAEST